MKRIHRISGVLLAGIFAGAPVYSDSNVIDLQNGYRAESDSVLAKLDLATAAVVGEVSLRQADGKRTLLPNGKYDQAPPAEWAFWFTMVCKAADSRDGDKCITDAEAQTYLDDVTKYLGTAPPPAEYFGH